MAIVYMNLCSKIVWTFVKLRCISLSVKSMSPNSRTDEMIVEWSWWFMLPMCWNVIPRRLRQIWLNIWRAYIGLRFLDFVIISSGVMSITSHIARNTSPHSVGFSFMSVFGLTISCLSIRTSLSCIILFSTICNRNRLISCLRLWTSWYMLVISK